MPRSFSFATWMEPVLEQLRILREQIVRRIGHALLQLEGTCCRSSVMEMTIWFFHSGNGVEDGALDALDEHLVVALDKADLRRRLDGDHAGELEVVDLLRTG